MAGRSILRFAILKDYETVEKKARMSLASNSGCSMAAKCPPAGITVQCLMLNLFQYRNGEVSAILWETEQMLPVF
ncbi:MAG: hypothetical protein JWP78_1030 [Mucilaginibacter sp.]|nr:hypothetical protein [Mucilaginibacter sp.]